MSCRIQPACVPSFHSETDERPAGNAHPNFCELRGLNGTVYTAGVVEDRMGQFTQLVWWRIESDSLHNWCGGGLNGTVYTTGVVED